MPKGFPVPEDFGAVGDGVTDDQQALQDFLDAIQNDVGYLNAKTYATGGSLSITQPTESIGGGGSAIRALAEGGSFDIIQSNQGGVGTATKLSVSAPIYSKTISVQNPSLFAAGDFVFIVKIVSAQLHLAQIGQIESIVGSALTLTVPLYFDADTTTDASPWTPLRSVTLRGFSVEGNNEPSSRGLVLNNLMDARVSDLRISKTGGAAISMNYGFYNHVSGILAEDCGDDQESDIFLKRHTESHFDRLVSRRASGFGPQLQFCHGCNVGSIQQEAAASRGVKILACSHNNFAQVISNLSGSTGAAITVNSYRTSSRR